MVAFMKEMISLFVGALLKVLPMSPFQRFLAYYENLPYLGILNWFIPVKVFIIIGMAWLGAIAVYYAWSVLMRWVKMIGD